MAWSGGSSQVVHSCETAKLEPLSPIESMFLCVFILWWMFMIWVGIKYDITFKAVIMIFTLVPIFVIGTIYFILGAMT